MRLSFFLFLTLLLISRPDELHAQRSRNRIITTDYNECLTGIKDTSGNWIVQPKYTYIESANREGTFVVWNYRTCGLIDSNGVSILPIAYDDIMSTAAKGFYIVTNNKRKGVVTAHDTIVPIVYRRVSVSYDSVSFVSMKKRKWEVYTPDGTRRSVRYKNRQTPFNTGPHLYAVRKSKLFGSDKYGLINDSGVVILRPELDGIGSTDHGLIFIQKNEKYGYINYAAATVWPVVLEQKYNLYYENFHGERYASANVGNIFSSDSINSACINGKYGLITAGGRTILPFEYDSISTTNPYADYPYNTIYYVKKNGRYGIYSTEQGWLIEPEQEVLEPLKIYITSVDSLPVPVILSKKEGFYGVSSSSGQIIVPYRYRNYTRVSSGFLLFNDDTLVSVDYYPRYLKDRVIQSQLGIPRDSVLTGYFYPAPLEIPGDKHFAAHTAQDGRRLFYHPYGPVKELKIMNRTFTAQAENKLLKVPDSVLMNAEIAVQSLLPMKKIDNTHVLYADSAASWNADNTPDDVYVLDLVTKKVSRILRVYHDDAHTYYQTTERYLFRDDGIVVAEAYAWEQINGMAYGEDRPQKFLMQRGDSCAVVNHDGTYHIAPFKGTIGFFNEKYVWTSPRYEQPTGNSKTWKLTERSTGRIIRWKYADNNNPIWGNFTTVTTRKHGQQLFNIARNGVVVSGYDRIEGMNAQGSLFMVTTCSGKAGIIDSTGKMLVDTNYYLSAQVGKTDQSYFFSSRSYFTLHRQFYRYSVLADHNGYIVFDNELQQVTDRSVVTDYLKSTLKVQDTFPLPLSSYRQNLSTYIVAERSDYARLRAWHWQNMTDSLCFTRRLEHWSLFSNRFSFIIPCEYCEKKSSITYRGAFTNATDRYRVKYAGDSLLSYYSDDAASESGLMTNVLLYRNGPRNITLDSLFRPDSEWKNFVINTVIGYVNSHLYVRGDCHNPAGFPRMLNQRFQLSPEGIHLYPQDFTEKFRELVITIPWAAAMPYVQEDVKPKLPVPHP
jgi:hypothetical protein